MNTAMAGRRRRLDGKNENIKRRYGSETGTDYRPAQEYKLSRPEEYATSFIIRLQKKIRKYIYKEFKRSINS